MLLDMNLWLQSEQLHSGMKALSDQIFKRFLKSVAAEMMLQ
jgi:hypothetical protein